MPDYEEERTRLKTIVNTTNDMDQLDTAQAALDRLNLGAAADHIAKIQARNELYQEKMAQLKIIIDGIQENQLTGAIDKLDGLLAEIKSAAEEAAGEDPS